MTKPVNVVKAYIDPFTGIVYADEGRSRQLSPIGFVISSGTSVGGALLHASLVGLDADDHTQYILVDGSRGFTEIPFTTATGVPTDPGDLVTKSFLDSVVVSGVAGVASLNSLTGTINLVGSGLADVSVSGNDIFVTVTGVSSVATQDKALVGAGSVTITSGTSTITVSGSDVAGSITIVSSLPPSPTEGSVVYLLPDKQFLGFIGTEWIILG